jgi:outer membrane protein assembly factor BamB
MRLTKLHALALALGGATLAGCLNTENRRPVEPRRTSLTEAVATGETRVRPNPVNEQRLNTFGLEIYWDSLLRDEAISKLQLEASTTTNTGTLYAFTESNRLYQIDVLSGKVNWVFDVKAPLSFQDHDRPVCEFNYPKVENDPIRHYDEVFFVAKDTLFALDKKDGSELWRVDLKFGAASPPQATPTHVLVGAWDQRVYAFRKTDPIVHDWQWRTDGDITARPCFRDRGTDAFVASRDGNLYTFEYGSGNLKGTFATGKRLTADPVVFRDFLYLGSEDTDFFALNAVDGKQEFRYPTGAPITKAPVVIANPTQKGASSATIYVTTDGPDGGVLAFLKGGKIRDSTRFAHEFIWKREGATRVLSRGRDVVFLQEPGGANDPARTQRIVKLDARAGYLRDEVKLTGVDYYLTNPCDPNDRKSLLGGICFVGFRSGWIVAYKEKSPYADY